MNESPTIGGSIRWAIRRWRAQLRRDGAAIALLITLLFAAGEPILCIIHCYMWLPIVSPHSVVTHQHHHLDTSIEQPGASSLLTTDVASLPSEDSPISTCSLHVGSEPGSNTPLPISPSPLHEMIMPLLLLCVPLLLIISRLVAPPGAAERVFISPPFRPPIPHAG